MTTSRRPRRKPAPAWIAAAALLLAACGGDDDAEAPTDTAATPATAEPAATEDGGDAATSTDGPVTDDGAATDEAPATDVRTDDADTTAADDTGDAETSDEPVVDGSVAPADDVPRSIDHVFGTTEVPAAPERVVALSEEFLLADLLALGVRPVASTSNDPNTFGGVDPAATGDIEILASADFNIEQLAALRPDLILAYPSYLDLVGFDTIAAVAPTVAIGDRNDDWRSRLRDTAAVFGLDSAADDVIAEVEAELDAARSSLDGLSVSALSVSPGPFIRAYTDERTTLTAVMDELGIEFVSGPGTDGTDDNGRIQLSLEQLELLQGEAIVLLQTNIVDGEDDALAAVTSSPLWPSLPAVEVGRVATLDRLAYPGASGTGDFATDLAAALDE